jgi:flagellar basal body rod protein FlgG
MDVSLFQAAAAMNASARWQEVISDNLAASQIPGFKKQDLSFSAVQAGYLQRAPGTSPIASHRFLMPQAGAATNFQPGELRSTGVPTDLAVEGPGFFQVQLPDGTHGYTRDGEFNVNAQGQLTTKQGLLVLGETGPVQLDVNNAGPISISPTGEVSQGGDLKGQLKITEFANPGALTATGTGFFIVTDPAAQPQAATNSLVRQGFLESANTSSVTEMSNLISAMRLFEANQKVIQMEDDRVGRLISDVANAS